MLDAILPLKEKLEKRLNLSRQVAGEKDCLMTINKVMRISLIASLSLSEKRNVDDLGTIVMSKSSQRIMPSFFTKDNKKSLYSALLKLRYKDCEVDWQNPSMVGRIVAKEIYRGIAFLSEDENLNAFLFSESNRRGGGIGIPALELLIGEYGEDMEAKLNINGRSVSNAQILVAGATGSGKTNLLAVLIQQFRNLSTETPYPTQNPLPFTPFKDFTGKTISEINLYSTEMASALCAIDRASVSATMSNRLSEAIVDAYKQMAGKPITFELLLKKYQSKMPNPDKDDSVTSVLKQLVRNHLFAEKDEVNLVDECFIVNMIAFPKDGPLAKAIVYFVLSKINNIYEQLPKQAVSDAYVQIRHFTIIDEAHYMLDFNNQPLRNLIAVGRNKGLSIILATQNMDSFKSKFFDFYANAQYPLIMKQQTIADSVVKDLFGVSGKDFQEIKSAIAGLQKGELIIKDNTLAELGLGNKCYKKIKVTRLI